MWRSRSLLASSGFAVVLFVLVLPLSAGASETITLRVEGMTCAGCEAGVQEALEKIPGVISARVSYERRNAVIVYDPTNTSPSIIASSLADRVDGRKIVDGLDSVQKDQLGESCHVTPQNETRSTPVELTPYRTEELRAAFNAARDDVRVVALLAPTCGACQHGQRVVQDVFTRFPNESRLRGFVVWLPMLTSDSEKAARSQAGSFTDARVSQQWDGERASGTMLAKTLNLTRTAWDVYLVYAPGVEWNGETPPQPTFWMHQLRSDSGADPTTCLNPTVLVSKVRELLRSAADGKQSLGR